jgi:hypothetical protein
MMSRWREVAILKTAGTWLFWEYGNEFSRDELWRLRNRGELLTALRRREDGRLVVLATEPRA